MLVNLLIGSSGFVKRWNKYIFQFIRFIHDLIRCLNFYENVYSTVCGRNVTRISVTRLSLYFSIFEI